MAEQPIQGIAQNIDSIVKSSGYDAQKAIDRVIEYAKTIPASQRGGITYADGTFVPYDDKTMVEGALSQLLVSARPGTFIGQDIREKLLGTSAPLSIEETFARERIGIANAIKEEPDLWAYSKSDIGKVVEGPEGPRLIIDPNAKSLTPEQMKIVRESDGKITPFNAATGYSMGFNPTTNKVYATVDEAPYSVQYGVGAGGEPKPIGESYNIPGKSWGFGQGGGMAFGSFTKIDNDTWRTAEGQTVTNEAFIRMLANYGYDASKIPVGEKVDTGEFGIRYQGTTFTGGTPITPNITPKAPPSEVVTAPGYIPPAVISGSTTTTTTTTARVTPSIPTAVTPTVPTSYTQPVTPSYSGAGTNTNPLRLNGVPFTGNYLGENYVNGISATSAAARQERQSAFLALRSEFAKYGLEGLVEDVRRFIEQDIPPAQLLIELRNTPAYQKRFSANADRLKLGLAALSEAEYIRNEDNYRQILRTYGLKQFDNDDFVKQFLVNDISPQELGERVVTAVNQLQMADPAITQTLKRYYGLNDSDMLGVILDPKSQLPQIQRTIAAAGIGTAAGRQGLNIGRDVAEQLAAQGVTMPEAERGYATIAEILPTAEKLSDIYGRELDKYGLEEAEQEVFNQLASAQRKRRQLAEREQAAFSGQAGLTRGALGTQTGGLI